MAGAKRKNGATKGPGNTRIVAALLEALAVRGRRAAIDRARKALGDASSTPGAAPSDWLGEGVVGGVFAAAEVEPGLARSIGHRLVEPDAVGLALYGAGLATPEKAYRRIQSLLPREASDARWEVDLIEARCADLTYVPAAEAPTPRVAETLCALRLGLLEAVPGLYGLLPAKVEERACVAQGHAVCRYRVRWQPGARRGLMTGIGSGAVVAGILGTTIGGTAFANSLWMIALVVGGALLAGAFGRVFDLSRQLEAVAGARRGQLALFDQVDEALAAKLDALSRAESQLENGAPAPTRVRLQDDAPAEGETIDQRAMLRIAHQIHAAAGDLECFFDAQESEVASSQGARASHVIGNERGLVREIREWSARLDRLAGEGEARRQETVDLRRLVERAIATARPSLTPTAVVRVEAQDGLPTIACEPVQIEHVVVQLVRNAVEASVELCDAPEVVVSLAPLPGGLELAVEDRGVGIESTAVDEVFDPFFGDRPAGSGHGLGLPVCLRIVEGHGGTLAIQNQARAGTRVSVVLPCEAPTEPVAEPPPPKAHAAPPAVAAIPAAARPAASLGAGLLEETS